MKIFIHRGATPNVGDDLNELLWPRLIPGLESIDHAEWLVGIGTILDARLNALPGRKIVMGSGYRPGPRREPLGNTEFKAVRGLLTAERLGLPASAAICDPGFLVAHLWPYRPTSSGDVAFIPHVYTEASTQVAAAALDAGIAVISATLDVDTFLERLSKCGRVYCESLHAAIFADALGIPWARVRAFSHFHEKREISDFKWRDTFSILDTSVDPLNSLTLVPVKRSWSAVNEMLRPAHRALEGIFARMLRAHRDDDAAFRLSDRERMEERISQLVGLARSL
jgi:succinoglycan biosynthesis protein ExoV